VFYNVRRYDLLEMEEMSRLFTVTETCKYLRISPPTLYRMIERGELVPVKIGKRTLFDRKDLDTFIDAAKGPLAKKPPKKVRKKRKSKAVPDRLF
jgi:excisionase family DNA binding protein